LNKKTVGLRSGLAAAGASGELVLKPPKQLPLQFLLNMMDDETQPITMRIDCAKAALPFLHHRKGLVDINGRDAPVTVQIVRFRDLEGEFETRDRLVEPGPVIEHDPLPTSHCGRRLVPDAELTIATAIPAAAITSRARASKPPVASMTTSASSHSASRATSDQTPRGVFVTRKAHRPGRTHTSSQSLLTSTPTKWVCSAILIMDPAL
jgi:hypothetical protein